MKREKELDLLSELAGLREAGSAFLDETVTRSPVDRYLDPDRFEAERRDLFRALPMIAAHSGELAETDSFLRRQLAGLPVLLTRDSDGRAHAFLNVCRHRGARLVDGDKGQCRGALVCPFHGWVYNTDGSLRGASRPDALGDFDRADFGLNPIELEIWHGFIFLRFHPGPQPSVATLLAPFDADFAGYRADTLLASDGWTWAETVLPVNWKSVRDVDNEGYHVPLAHPSLQELYGRDYRDLYLKGGLSASFGYFGDKQGRRWSVRHYLTTTEERTDLPPHLRNAWSYYGIFPNQVFAFTPEGAQFYHDLPVSTRKTRLTGRLYRRPVEERRQRLARYLAARIDRDTSAEDQQLTIWSNEAMKSQAFDGFHLSDLEYGVRRHHDRLRALLPVMRHDEAPAEADLARLNAESLGKLASAIP